MQKKVLIFLIALVVGLLIANVVVLTLGVKKITDQHSSPERSQKTSQPLASSAGASTQIKQATLPSHSFIAIPASTPHLVSTDQESIGAQAGKTVGELQQKSQESYEVLNQRAQQTAVELEKTSQEAMKVLNQQTAKTAQDLQVALTGILQNFSVELEKFNEELKKKQTK